MSISHILEYSKTSKAKCHAPPPCQGTPIERGSLRYGQATNGEYGEVVKWRHWGCVTPDILQLIASEKLESISGFMSLKPADKTRIRKAVANQHVDPSDMTNSAKSMVSSSHTASSSVNPIKRKAELIDLTHTDDTSLQEAVLKNRARNSHSIVIDVDDSDDALEEIEAEEETKDELYCVTETQVVGIQYYSGLVGPGEEVVLIREPQNRYDANAIQVKNIAGMQVGHIPRAIASKLSPLLDQHRVTVEGVIRDGNLSGRTYSISMSLKVYGASSERSQLEPLLIWATPRQRGFPPTRADGSRIIPGAPTPLQTYNYDDPDTSRAEISSLSLAARASIGQISKASAASIEALRKVEELRGMLNALEKVDDDSRRSSLLDTLCSKDDILNLPVHANPPGIATGDLVTDLMKHQSQGLQWCLGREYPKLPKTEADEPVQFWQFRKIRDKAYYYNLATHTPQEALPYLGRGALYADGMGLGKTLTMLALILATKSDVPSDYSKTTLIVVPLSVLSNWETQIKSHCTHDALSFYVYYGSARSISPAQMKNFDVILTTYQVVTREYADSGAANVDHASQVPKKKRKKGTKSLFDVHWKRIILDEGHTIRNPRTQMFRAVCGLSAQRRWVVTGTPIINSPKDLGSIIAFLQICKPLDEEDFFKRLLLRPLKDGNPAGYELLRALMSQVCIRRTKEMQDKDGKSLVPLPGVEMVAIPIQLDEKARELYNVIEELSKRRFESYLNEHGRIIAPSNALSMLTRLRQLVLHPGLIPADYIDQLKNMDDDTPKPAVKLTPQDKLKLQVALAQIIEDNEECPICFEVLDHPVITPCSHAFCLECITQAIIRDTRCPMDRRQITSADLIEPAPETDLTQLPMPVDKDEDKGDDELRTGSSAKIDQLLHLLQLTPSDEKSLVFSQFTSFLDKIADALDNAGISYVRFDGKMSAKRRQETLERFAVPVPSEVHSESSGHVALSETAASSGSEFVADETDDDDGDFEVKGNNIDAWLKKVKKGKTKGKGKARKTKTRSSGSPFSRRSSQTTSVDRIPKVMLISLKAGALGLNLTVANNVYLMDPWWQEGIESQAIDRCNRIGQKRKVHVYQLIAENTVESKVIDIQERKKKLIKEAFSGTKANETQTQKKEARLQDLIELFGIRQQEATQRQTTLRSARTIGGI